MKIQRSIEIAAPREKVWPFLVEPEKILKWCITFEKFEYTSDQRNGVGTPFYLEERAAGRPMKLNFVVTEWLRHKRLAFSMTSGDFVKAYEQVWTLEATPSGSRFTFMEEIEFPYGIIGKTLGLFGRLRPGATVGEMLAKLKRLAER